MLILAGLHSEISGDGETKHVAAFSIPGGGAIGVECDPGTFKRLAKAVQVARVHALQIPPGHHPLGGDSEDEEGSGPDEGPGLDPGNRISQHLN